MEIITRQVENKSLTVTIEYPEYTESVKGLIRKIESLDVSFSVTAEDRQMRIARSDVYYLEIVDRKAFLYTEKDVFRLDASMQEILNLTLDSDLVRISRTCIMNTSHLTEIRQLKNSHLEATLDNGEKLIVSRKYLRDIKRRF
ncbi:MAG: LytTR family transcriptional regulator DNA-binding domain-containing protein [Clostridiales bacterium]|nr:LytTR family transcriptional regulator DNA-binding domain-containing protein [Clostridiales bacterium]